MIQIQENIGFAKDFCAAASRPKSVLAVRKYVDCFETSEAQARVNKQVMTGLGVAAVASALSAVNAINKSINACETFEKECVFEIMDVLGLAAPTIGAAVGALITYKKGINISTLVEKLDGSILSELKRDIEWSDLVAGAGQQLQHGPRPEAQRSLESCKKFMTKFEELQNDERARVKSLLDDRHDELTVAAATNAACQASLIAVQTLSDMQEQNINRLERRLQALVDAQEDRGASPALLSVAAAAGTALAQGEGLTGYVH